MQIYTIAKHLTETGIKTPGGKEKWQTTTIESILSNEKYKGDALLQKTYTVDFLTKKTKVNEGEIPQNYVENSHPAIVDPDEFDAVQVEFRRRKSLGRPGTCQSPLSTKLICSECGGYYGRKVWCSNTPYRRIIWRCNEKYKEGKKCSTSHVTEEEIEKKFVEVVNSVLPFRKEFIENCRLVQARFCNTKELEEEIEELHQKIEEIVTLSRRAIYENAHKATSQEEWAAQNNKYIERHRKAVERLESKEEEKRERQGKKQILNGFIKGLEAQEDFLTEFDEFLWNALLEKVVVSADGTCTFCFKDGTKMGR